MICMIQFMMMDWHLIYRDPGINIVGMSICVLIYGSTRGEIQHLISMT